MIFLGKAVSSFQGGKKNVSAERKVASRAETSSLARKSRPVKTAKVLSIVPSGKAFRGYPRKKVRIPRGVLPQDEKIFRKRGYVEGRNIPLMCTESRGVGGRA